MKLVYLIFVIAVAGWAIWANWNYLRDQAKKKPELQLRRLGNTNIFYYTAI